MMVMMMTVRRDEDEHKNEDEDYGEATDSI